MPYVISLFNNDQIHEIITGKKQDGRVLLSGPGHRSKCTTNKTSL